MSFPPLHPSQNSIASRDSQASNSGSARPRQSAWGLSAQSSSRRGLTPLATNVAPPSDSAPRPGSSGPSANNTTTSPFTSSFSSVLGSASRLNNGRNSSTTSSSQSLLTSLQTGSQQLSSNQLLSSPRSRATTPFSNSNLASSAAASTTASKGGGGGSSGGGGTSRPSAFSPASSAQSLTSPTNSTFERNIFGSSNSGSRDQHSVSKITVTQVFILLGSLTEKEGKAKWDLQVEAIRKLIRENGMEVFAKYFRRLLVGNSTHIFSGNHRNVEKPGNYPLLVEEILKASQELQQAQKVAEVIDTSERSEGDIFRDFDLATFVSHFKLDPIAQTILVVAFTQATKPDLRAKALTLLATTFPSLIQALSNIDDSKPDTDPAVIATAAFRSLLFLPDDARDGSEKSQIILALESRYSKLGTSLPSPLRSAMALVDIIGRGHELAEELIKQGPSVTAGLDNTKDFLRRYSRSHVDASQIGAALLATVLSPESNQHQPQIFVKAVRELFQSRIDWQDVVKSFDCDNLLITQSQFLSLYQALLPIAQTDGAFDIQKLWGGPWRNKAALLSFAIAFASMSSSQLNATTVPGLTMAYDPRDWEDVPEDFIPLIDVAVADPMISKNAVASIIEGLWDSSQSSPQDIAYAKQVVGEKMTLFLSSAGGIPKPWVSSHQILMTKTLKGCLEKTQPEHRWLLHCFWSQDKPWLAARLMEIHADDPLKLPILLQNADEHGWLGDLCTMISGFGIDLAALAHRNGIVDLHDWAREKLERNPDQLVNSLTKFLTIKAQDEMRTIRNEQPAPQTVSLAMKTVHTMLAILEDNITQGKEALPPLERLCMQAFPRLCNYGEGYDTVIDENGRNGNTLPPSADAEMQELYKRMYSKELEVRHVIEALRDCKISNEPDRQELFACMIHGLFDEYICFNEYPLDPLATTAVLFGGIINYRLINNFALNVALEMVLESLRDYPPESSMFKFGLQALLHFLGRLPEWPDLLHQLVQIPGLQGTPAYGPIQAALRERRDSTEANGVDGIQGEQKEVNGNLDEFVADSLVPQFRSVNVDANIPESIEDPAEAIQDRVLFVLNNVSEQNLLAKVAELSLQPQHYAWFASYLVEQRAKSQPNYQQLYLEMLNILGDKALWADVLRETYVSVRKVLNAESTMKSPIERTYLKNLGIWLGQLTLARDKPIKHKHIAFKELLIEGWETQRLLITIPFTCEVLGQGANSIVFKPPNPWIMEIISLLLELYDLPETKIQQKFAVEVLLGTFGLPRKGEGMERSNELAKRLQRFEEERADPMLSDGLDGFDELSMGNLTRGVRNARFSPTAMALPDLEQLLVFPPTSSPVNQAKLKQVVQEAIHRSIVEIIGPVVERSVTIATIAAKDLVTKDYSQEGDEDRLREALENVAKTTSGSLASVTCKEPLRMSITNHIRNAALESDQPLAEGAVLMSVNDNLDIACKIVERQAEERALPEIKAHIENEIAKRREHKAAFPNEPYRDPATSQWSTYISEPYKQMPGGLNQQQLEIYENFAPQARGIINHNQSGSTDSGKQIPDVLQDAGFPNVPNLSTPAEQPVLPHQAQSQQAHGNTQLAIPGARSTSALNGYMDVDATTRHIHGLCHEIFRVAKSSPEGTRFKDLLDDSAVLAFSKEIVQNVAQSPPQDMDALSMATASFLFQALFTVVESKLEAEAAAQIMQKMCQISNGTFMTLTAMLRKSPDTKMLNPSLTAALLEVGLLEYSHVDAYLGRGLRLDRNPNVLRAFADLLDAVLFTDEPLALRSDFVICFRAIGDWATFANGSPEVELSLQILDKLKSAGMPETIDIPTDHASRVRQEQIQYAFSEWVGLFSHPGTTDATLISVVSHLYQDLLKTNEDTMLFFRLSVEAAVEFFEHNMDLHINDAHIQTDALARFVVILVTNQGENEQRGKSDYLRSILNLLVLILNNHHVMRGERFSQKSFFRLFSSIFYDWHEEGRESIMIGNDGDEIQDRETILAFADTILLLEPTFFPGFTYGWLSLVSHRVFMPAILKNGRAEGSDAFAKIMEVMLSYVGNLLKSSNPIGSARDLYRGVLRILLILHHDFPEFLADNHYKLCNVISPHCTQLRNLVLSAFPTSILELPDPFSAGLKVDRLEEIRKSPIISGDILAPLLQANLKDIIDNLMQSSSIPDDTVSKIAEAIYATQRESPQELVSALVNSLVLYIGQSAIESAAGPKTPTFSNSSPHAILLSKLAREIHPETRYYFLNAIANQLRYPNSHTHFFSYALLHLFGTDQADQQESDIRQQITRVLLERLIVHRPHPWGLIITLLELLKNPAYMFWELPFIKAAPEIEKLFGVLFVHINNGSRATA